MNVLVVGGSSSVGRAVVDAFERDGANVLPTYMWRPFERHRSVRLNVTDAASIAALSDSLTATGPIDVAVFLAAVLPGRSLVDYAAVDFDRVMAVNITGTARVIQALLPHLAAPSQILLTSSISAERGSFDPIYAASKGAIASLAKSLAVALAPKTRTNVVSPGLIEDSTMAAAMTDERRRYHRERTPTGELLQLADLAKVFVDLTKPHWRGLNGAVVSLNGGYF